MFHATVGRSSGDHYSFTPDLKVLPGEALVEVMERAENPVDVAELEALYLGRVECLLGEPTPGDPRRRALAERWRSTRPRRAVEPGSMLADSVLPGLVKRLFNAYFRDDLYGSLRSPHHLVLSGGTADETRYGLPDALKDCLRIATDRDWYGYSDSLGRTSARVSVAGLENLRVPGADYDERRVALTLGGTAAISGLMDMISLGAPAGSHPRALCAIPSYPPLVTAASRRMAVELVPVTIKDGITDITPLLERTGPGVAAILLQTVTNPSGTAVPENQIAELIQASRPGTLIILDECHECLGEEPVRCVQRADSRVVRVTSLSKTFSAPGLKIGWIIASEQLISDYYEYASTSYGGPPSIYYLLTEVLARFERWLRLGIAEVSASHMAEWEVTFQPSRNWVEQALDSFRRQRIAREQELIRHRDESFAKLYQAGLRPIRPTHSLNLAFSPPGTDDYLDFRRLLSARGVSVLPGILNFVLDGKWLRLTTARTAEDLQTGLFLLERRPW